MKVFKWIRERYKKRTNDVGAWDPAKQLAGLKSEFGDDFAAFLYQPGVDDKIRAALLSVLEASDQYNGFLDHDHWAEKHPFNFPGPFYTGQSDSCGTGHIAAPNNVLYDADCLEYLFRQPGSLEELNNVLDAADVEVFDSYACNGNRYWTYKLCKEWWRNRSELIHQLNMPELKKMNEGREQLYLNYLNTQAETDLRRYCFFLENSFYPPDGNTLLPDL